MARPKKKVPEIVAAAGQGVEPLAVTKAQPMQLDLFRLTELPYTNAFDFYEAIPRFIVGGTRSRYYTPDGRIAEVKRNPDGTSLPVERFYEYQGRGYTLEIQPVLIKQKGGGHKALFPGVREEIIETVLFKLAVERGYFASYQDTQNPESYTLFTSLYEIQKELERQRGAVSYSNTQIREALKILQKASYTMTSRDDGTEYNFQLISDFGHFNKEYEETGTKATIYIRFNAMISTAILKRNWRLINYESLMKEESFLARWFRKRLGLVFTYAQLGKSYNIKLSTIINSSGVSLYDQFRDNLAFVTKTLDELEIVERIHVEKEYEVNPATKRKILKDALFVIYPTMSFSNEQIRANQHAKKISSALPDEEGKPLINPELQFDLKGRAKEEARRKYLKAQGNM